MAGFKTVMYMWQGNSFAANMNVMFQNDALVSRGAVWIAVRSPSIATNAPDQGVRALRDRRQSIGLCKMAATNKYLERSNKSHAGVPATKKRPASRAQFLCPPPIGAYPLRGQRCRSFTALWRRELSGS